MLNKQAFRGSTPLSLHRGRARALQLAAPDSFCCIGLWELRVPGSWGMMIQCLCTLTLAKMSPHLDQKSEVRSFGQLIRDHHGRMDPSDIRRICLIRKSKGRDALSDEKRLAFRWHWKPFKCFYWPFVRSPVFLSGYVVYIFAVRSSFK